MTYSTFYLTKGGQVIPTVTGTLSFLSSLLILSCILRSEKKLGTVYHRIMFAVSIGDMLSSLAMALTTIPMPADVADIYPYQGKAFGTTRTCEAQSFIMILGTAVTLCSMCSLSTFYFAILFLEIPEEKYKKCLEKYLAAASFVFSLTVPIGLFSLDLLNPNPYESYCSWGPYPLNCNADDKSNSMCIRGDKASHTTLFWIRLFLAVVIGLQGMGIMVTSMCLILYRVYRNEKQNTHTLEGFQKETPTDISEEEPQMDILNIGPRRQHEIVHYKNTKIIAWQANLYVCMTVLTWSFALASLPQKDSRVIQILKLVFLPLQGFMNAIVFISLKVHSTRRSYPTLKVKDALYIVIFNPSAMNSPDMYVSRMSIVEEDYIRSKRKESRMAYLQSLMQGPESVKSEDDDLEIIDTSVERGEQEDIAIPDPSSPQLSPLCIEYIKDDMPRTFENVDNDIDGQQSSMSFSALVRNGIVFFDSASNVASIGHDTRSRNNSWF